MSSQYGELVGFDEAHYAKVVSDALDQYLAATAAYLAPGGEIKHEAKTDTATRYYDNKPMFTTVTEAATDVTVTVSGVPMKLAAELTGKPYDAARGVLQDTGDASNAPYFAFGGRMSLGDGGYRYFWYLKGIFSIGTQTAKTKEDKTTVNTVDLTYTALATVHEFELADGTTNSLKGLFADTTDQAFVGGNNWFAQVQTPDTIGAPGALSITDATPESGTSGVALSVAPTLTFSNVLADYSGISLVNTTTGALMACKVSIDSTGKIATVTPLAALAATTVYLLVLSGVTDIYGQTLASTAIKFTTAES